LATRTARNRCATLDLLLKQANLKFDPYASVSDDIVKALRANQKIEAIKLYRQVTGVGLKEAKEFIRAAMSRGENIVGSLPEVHRSGECPAATARSSL
jgi:hypothetical protein